MTRINKLLIIIIILIQNKKRNNKLNGWCKIFAIHRRRCWRKAACSAAFNGWSLEPQRSQGKKVRQSN